MDHVQARSTSETDVKRDTRTFIKKDLNEPGLAMLLGKVNKRMLIKERTIEGFFVNVLMNY